MTTRYRLMLGVWRLALGAFSFTPIAQAIAGGLCTAHQTPGTQSFDQSIDRRTEKSSSPVYAMEFSRGLSAYKVGNFRNLLTVTNGTFRGESCFQVLPAKKPADTAWSIVSPQFAVKPGAVFAIRTRACGLTDMSQSYGGTCMLWFGVDGKILKTVDVLGKTVDLKTEFGFRCNPENWVETTEYGTVPDGAAKAMIKCGADNPDVGNKGSVMISFVRYYESDDKAKLQFGGDFDGPVMTQFTPCRPCADFSAPIDFTLEDPSDIDEVSLRVTLDGQDVTEKVKSKSEKVKSKSGAWSKFLALFKRKAAPAKPATPSKRYSYASATPWAEGSLHKFTISVADKLGNRLADERTIYFTQKPVRHAKLEVRDDGVMIRNGKTFYPMSIFAFGGNKYNGGLEKGTQELLENGYTLISTYMSPLTGWAAGKRYKDLADMAAKYDLSICAPPIHGMADSTDPVKMKKIADDICAAAVYGRDLPATGIWEVGDDTASNRKAGSVRRDDLAIKAIDGDVLTSQVDISKLKGRYKAYAPYTDIFRVEIYPMRDVNPQPDEMAQVKRDMEVAYADLEQSGAKNRSIWAVPQAFLGWGMWKRFPSYEELRCETLLAIACRARGIAYYTYASGEWGARVKPETWADLCKVTREVKSLEKDLVSRDAAKQPKLEVVEGPKRDPLGQFPVTALLKDTGRLIAAASAIEPVTVRFTMPDGKTFTHRFERNGVLVK